MKTLKKLLLAVLLLCSSSSFANTGGGGFDDPVELFKFYYKVAEEARIYRVKHGKYNPSHIKKLAPHVYAADKKYLEAARGKISTHESFVRRSKSYAPKRNHTFIVEMRYKGPYFDKYEGTATIPYTYYRFQQKEINGLRDKSRPFSAKAKKVGNKIRWYIYR